MSDTEASRLLLRRSMLLRELDGEARETDSLHAAVDLSESTINRAIYDLEAAGYIEQCADGYRTTLTGRLALGVYDRFLDRIEAVQESIDLLSVLDADAPLPPGVVSSAETVHATGDGTHPDRIERLVADAQRIRSLPSWIAKPYFDLYCEQVSGGAKMSLVVPSSLTEQLISHRGEELIEAIATGRVALKQADEQPQFGTTIVETDTHTTVEIRVYGPEGLRGSIINDTETAIEWATDRYETIWERALLVQPSDDSS